MPEYNNLLIIVRASISITRVLSAFKATDAAMTRLEKARDAYRDLQRSPVNLGRRHVSVFPELNSLIAGVPGFHTCTPGGEMSFKMSFLGLFFDYFFFSFIGTTQNSCISVKALSKFQTICMKWLVLMASYEVKRQHPLLSTLSEQNITEGALHTTTDKNSAKRCTMLLTKGLSDAKQNLLQLKCT